LVGSVGDEYELKRFRKRNYSERRKESKPSHRTSKRSDEVSVQEVGRNEPFRSIRNLEKVSGVRYMSKQFSLNGVDFQRIFKNAVIFLAPALIVLIASFQDIVPKDASWAVVALFVLNVVTDLIRKFVAGR